MNSKEKNKGAYLVRTEKFYILIGLGLVLLGIVYLALRSDVPDEPIVIYKATTPLPKQEIREDTSRVGDVTQESMPTRLEEPSAELQGDLIFVDSPDSPESLEDRETLPVSPELQPQSGVLPNVVDFKITPQGYPLTPYWDLPADRQADWTYRDKLIDHVLVKLWREGNRNFDGGSMGENGQVHPHYTDTLYVEWEKWKHPDGSMRDVITHSFGASGIWQRPRGDPYALPPSHVNLIDIDLPEGQGIDPYTFLSSTELPK